MDFELLGTYEVIDSDSIHVDTDKGTILLHPSEHGFISVEEFIKKYFKL